MDALLIVLIIVFFSFFLIAGYIAITKSKSSNQYLKLFMTQSKSGEVSAHDQTENHSYIVHYPFHGPRKDDPHYKDFNSYHKRTRPTARCYIGERVGFGDCKDEKGNPVPAPDDPNAQQEGLELHHTHIEFALTNGVNLKALEKDYPGVSDPSKVGAWVESGDNFRWLCTYHHRAAGGAHTATHSDWEGSQYIQGLISPNA